MKQSVLLPDIGSLTKFVHQEVLHDVLVKKSVSERYVTEKELVAGRYVSTYLHMNCGIAGEGQERDNENPLYRLVIVEACTAAATAFGITNAKAEELYYKSQDIRAVQIEDFPPEYFQWPGNKKEV